MRYLYSLIFLSSILFADIQVDRIYSFIEYTKKDTDISEEFTNVGVLLEGSSEVFESEITGSVRALHDEQSEDENYNSVDIKELYAKKYFRDDIYSVSIGREVSSFGVAKTHSLVDFFTAKNSITNSDDKSLELIGSDGANVVYEDEYKIAFYSYDVDKGSSNNIFEISKMYDSYTLSFYLNKNLEAFTSSISINDYFNFNGEFKNEEDKFDTILGVDYTPTSDILISLEKIFLNTGETKEQRLSTLQNISSKSKDERSKYFNSLTSKKYTNIYIRYSVDDISTSFYTSINETDKSKRYLAQVEYSFDSYAFLVEYLANNGENNSEYSDSLMKDKLLFHISWRYN